MVVFSSKEQIRKTYNNAGMNTDNCMIQTGVYHLAHIYMMKILE